MVRTVADHADRMPAFLEEVDRTHRELWRDFDAFCRDAGAGGLPGTCTCCSVRPSGH